MALTYKICSNKTIKALRLESYLRDYQVCDINEIDIDDTIIRLKE